MTLPEGPDAQSMNVFMKTEMDTSTPIVWERNSKNDQNTAVYQLFAGKAVSAGMSGLCGCTGLLIVSRQGWLLAHYWESSSFDPDTKWGSRGWSGLHHRQADVDSQAWKGSQGMLDLPVEWIDIA